MVECQNMFEVCDNMCRLLPGVPGYVRHTSSNVEPVQDAEDNEAYYTLARPVPVEPKTAAKKHRSAAQHVTRPRHRHH